MGRDGVGGELGRVALGAGDRVSRLGDQRRGIGVEPQADLAAAPFYERREPVGEGLRLSRP